MSFSGNELQSQISSQPQNDDSSDKETVGVGSGEQVSERLYPIDSRALARLAQGSSVLIASVLAIPDGIALIPGATSSLAWVLRLIGVWISAAVLWFVGFLAILHAVRLFVRGVRVSSDGVRLWRFGRPIKWERLEAFSVEPQFFFSRILSLSPPARKLTIFSTFQSGKFVWKKLLVPNPVPSFLFKPEDFEALARDLSLRRFDIKPQATNGVFFAVKSYGSLKSTFKALEWQRVLVSILVAVGLVAFIGKKAGANYTYNSGNSALARNELQEAKRLYRLATEIDPFFFAPWNNLANVEFRLGEFDEAYKHWEKALSLKPDFVEPMVSLSYIYLQRRQFSRAKAMIDRALALAPANPYALVNRADYFMRLGQIEKATADARLVLSQKGSNEPRPRFMAGCLLAQGLVKRGEPEKALLILERIRFDSGDSQLNKTFWLLVNGEAQLALGNKDAADDMINQAAARAPNNLDVLLDLARLALLGDDFVGCEKYLSQAMKRSPQEPWIALLQSRLALKKGNREFCLEKLSAAVERAGNDATIYAEAAQIYLSAGERKRAIESASHALALEADLPAARRVVERAR